MLKMHISKEDLQSIVLRTFSTVVKEHNIYFGRIKVQR